MKIDANLFDVTVLYEVEREVLSDFTWRERKMDLYEEIVVSMEFSDEDDSSSDEVVSHLDVSDVFLDFT